jgi:hypothetical protein
MHHEIIRPLLNKVVLKQEREGAAADVRKLVPQGSDLESKIDVKLLAGLKIFGRDEWPQ